MTPTLTPLSARSPPPAPNALLFLNVPEVSFHPEYALPSASSLPSYPLGVCESRGTYETVLTTQPAVLIHL